MKHDFPSLAALAADLAASSDAVSDGLAAARRLAEEAEASRVRAEAAVNGSLLSVDDKALNRLDAECDAAKKWVRRATALVVALEDRLAAARSAEDGTRKRQAYAAALAARDAAAARLAREYPDLAQAALALLRAVAEADLAVARVNDDLPEGAERLSLVELVARVRPGAARKVLDERTVDLWCHEGSADPLPPEMQPRVIRQDDGRGYYSTGTGQSYCRRQRFRQTTTLPAIPAQHPDSLASVLVLPPLRPGEPVAWKLDGHAPRPDEILRHLDAIAVADAVSRPAPKRVPEVEYEPVAG